MNENFVAEKLFRTSCSPFIYLLQNSSLMVGDLIVALNGDSCDRVPWLKLLLMTKACGRDIVYVSVLVSNPFRMLRMHQEVSVLSRYGALMIEFQTRQLRLESDAEKLTDFERHITGCGAHLSDVKTHVRGPVLRISLPSVFKLELMHFSSCFGGKQQVPGSAAGFLLHFLLDDDGVHVVDMERRTRVRALCRRRSANDQRTVGAALDG